ncbi:hypothetical protein [Lacinutrix sp. Hel_I_90]|uniref:hypothetical protein n=1 Tax=Lacinutrix sp. Hel_I_90 TaxID=1249999 RepID=UPI0005CAC19C|nr:hypothetical protein [Lacinutrix sp. Hel_I_90]
MQKHIILHGTQDEIDNSKSLSHILKKCNAFSILNCISPTAAISTQMNLRYIGENVDLVLVYTNNNQLDFCEVLQYIKSNVYAVKKALTFVFLTRTKPFVVNSYISKHFNVIDVSKEDEKLEFLDNTVSLSRIDSKIQFVQEMIDAVDVSNNYSKSEKDLFNNYFKKTIHELNVERYKYSNNLTKEVLASINVNH